jgi:hypothetical protein
MSANEINKLKSGYTKKEGGCDMWKDKLKALFTRQPVEKHDTAAWANIKETKAESNVPIPDIIDVENAKEYVEENKK